MQSAHSTRAGKVMGAMPSYAEGGLVATMRAGMNRLVGNNPAAMRARGRSETEDAPKPVAAPVARANPLVTKDNPAGIRFGKGGPVPGKSPTKTADNIDAKLTAGEYVMKVKAVEKLGVPFMDAVNAVADGPGKNPTSKTNSKVQKFDVGGTARKTPAERLADMNTKAAGQRIERASTVSDLNSRTTLGAAPPSNKISYVMPPEPIAATTSPGARATSPGARAAPPVTAQPAAAPAARVAPQSAVSFSGDPLYPNSQGTAPSRPATAVPAAAQPAAPAAPARSASFKAGQATARMGGSVARTAAQVGRSVVAGGAGALLAGTTTDLQNPAYQPDGNNVVDPRMAQIPTGGVPGAGPTPKTEPYNFYTDTETGRNIGNIASAASMIPGVGLLGKATAPAAAAMSAVGGFGAQVRADRGAPAAPPVVPQPAPAVPPPAAVAPVAAVAPPPAVAPQPVAPQVQGAMLPPGQQPGQPSGQVTRVGNSYSGQNVAGDITINGQAPTRGGFVSGTGDGSFTYGGSSQVGDLASGGQGGGTDQALAAARMAAVQRGDVQSVKDSYGGDFGPKVSAVDQLMNNGRPMTTKKAAAIAAIKAAESDQSGKKEDRQLARDKFGLEKSTAGISAKGKARLDAAEEAVLSAKTPEARVMAAKNLEALQGRSQRDAPPEEYAAVAGGTDAMGNKTDPLIYSKRTGQRAGQDAASAMPASKSLLVAGKVYQTAQGPATWDGSKFTSQ
jgi:hypothetical protein